MPISDVITDVFSEFVRLRQMGKSRDDAWYAVAASAKAKQFSEEQVQRLLDLALDWEAREGHQYRAQSEDKAYDTLIADSGPTQRDLLKRLYQNTLNTDPPHKGTAKLTGLEFVEQRELETGYFGYSSELLFHIPRYDQVIHVKVFRNTEVIVGRSTPNTAMAPEIDLSKFDKGMHGVSRMHAALKRQDNTLMIQDLGSANHTFVNEVRLFPHELRMLRDGDSVSFARMLVQVRFLHK